MQHTSHFTKLKMGYTSGIPWLMAYVPSEQTVKLHLSRLFKI